MRSADILWLLILALGATGCASRSPTTTVQTISFQPVKLLEREFIQSFTVELKNGRVVAINRLPEDWDMDLVRDHPGFLTMTWQARHFSAGLPSLQPLDGFLTVAKEGGLRDADATAPLEITVTLVTGSSDPPGRDPRTMVLSGPDLILKPQGGRD